MVIADSLFWLVAALQVIVSIGFMLQIRKVKPKQRKPVHRLLARGQYQDGLLSAMTLWAVLLSRGSPLMRSALDLLGTLVLLWLMTRTIQRLRSLRGLD